MKLLLQAALRSSRHLALALITLGTLLCLSIANSCEMFSMGLMANTGADFFSLFSPEGKGQKEKIRLRDVVERWDKIDENHDGVITKRDAALYLSQRRGHNPLQLVMHWVSARFDISANIGLLILIISCVALFKAVTLFAARYATQLLSIRVTRDLRQQYFEHIQSLPLSFYQDYNLGSLTSRAVGDAGQIASSLNSCLTNYFQTPFTILSNLMMCFVLSWKLSLIIFFGLPLIVLPVLYLTRQVKRLTRQLQRNQENFTSVLLDFLSGIQTIKIFAMEAFSLRKYKEQNDRMAHLESKSAKYGLMTRPILHLVSTACLATVVLVGLYSFHMTIGELLMFSGLLYLFYEPVKKFAEENSNMQKGVVAAERMFEVLQIKPQIEDQEGAQVLDGFREKIEFDHVWFRYRDEWVLRDLTFTINKGEIVAIVGSTGSGKSTLVQLIPRLYEVQKGEIRIDGLPLQKFTQRSIREQLAVVPQRPFLFYDTVAENISFGRNYTRAEIEEAARKAHAHEFIVNLPKGYDTLLAEMGKSLSGGQAQRIAIARALVKKAPLLILDEATSSLDALSELKIQDAIESLHGEVTQLIIAHRLTTIEHADRILFIERGQLLAQGTRAELLERCLPFRALWDTYYRTEGAVALQKN